MLTTISKVLEQAPELAPLVKEANSWEEFPVENLSQATFSYILSNYLEKTAEIYDIPEHVKRAAKVFKLQNPEVNRIIDKLVNKNLPKLEESSFQALNEKQAEEFLLEKSASDLSDMAGRLGYSFENPELAIRSGQRGFEKQAAVELLEGRVAASEDPRYALLIEKLAEMREWSEKDSWVVGQAVEKLDRETGLHTWGFNFCKEAAVHRSALLVRLAKKDVPVETLLRARKQMEDMVGEKLPDNPQELKTVVETLPLDLRGLIERHLA